MPSHINSQWRRQSSFCCIFFSFKRLFFYFSLWRIVPYLFAYCLHFWVPFQDPSYGFCFTFCSNDTLQFTNIIIIIWYWDVRSRSIFTLSKRISILFSDTNLPAFPKVHRLRQNVNLYGHVVRFTFFVLLFLAAEGSNFLCHFGCKRCSNSLFSKLIFQKIFRYLLNGKHSTSFIELVKVMFDFLIVSTTSNQSHLFTNSKHSIFKTFRRFSHSYSTF